MEVTRWKVLVDDLPMTTSAVMPTSDVNRVAMAFVDAERMAEIYQDINPDAAITVEWDVLEHPDKEE